ncbi:MAG: formate dehydrogenase accessory sulfurtransferase FdhD [Chloroflexi bacterium]|nr:formate dehydrogenase accessory sulfurtransferase FdhD [Chloroflexota bacterium]
MDRGVVLTDWHEYQGDWSVVNAGVIEEELITIYVNAIELVVFMASPCEQDYLAIGFLKNEGLIEGIEEIEHIHISRDGCCVDVWLDHAFEKPEHMIITSGCGGGVTFVDPRSELAPNLEEFEIDPQQLGHLFGMLHSPESLHANARGVHSAGLSDGENIMAMTEDIGRHNTIDKLRGICLSKSIETQGRILLATGRISSEMLRKGALMGCPIIASRNSPTSMSVAMAEAWNITLVGYVRRNSLRVYAHPERLRGENGKKANTEKRAE